MTKLQREPPAWCSDCGRALASAASIEKGVCGLCARRRRQARRAAIADGFEDLVAGPDDAYPWDGWGT